MSNERLQDRGRELFEGLVVVTPGRVYNAGGEGGSCGLFHVVISGASARGRQGHQERTNCTMRDGNMHGLTSEISLRSPHAASNQCTDAN